MGDLSLEPMVDIQVQIMLEGVHWERKGKRRGKERKGKERKGKERKGKERKGKERKREKVELKKQRKQNKNINNYFYVSMILRNRFLPSSNADESNKTPHFKLKSPAILNFPSCIVRHVIS
ncbi:hypothetical protein llap_16743 [Limosa lapponica baueri]|uniref:Uncharacterized protein n=1 Tax=Limosa lapponica baueri TaxID=1758121 RepID=A0A2I0TGM2_LIMLA|nr:hypothetical protein llap_16743 [Limosa lapponica baueri]